MQVFVAGVYTVCLYVLFIWWVGWVDGGAVAIFDLYPIYK
jgi:hypothetical protein